MTNLILLRYLTINFLPCYLSTCKDNLGHDRGLRQQELLLHCETKETYSENNSNDISDHLKDSKMLSLWLTRTSTQDIHQEINMSMLKNLINTKRNSSKHKTSPYSGQPTIATDGNKSSKDMERNGNSNRPMEKFYLSSSDDVAEQKDKKGHDNQQVVYRSKKHTDSSSNSMKGMKISILSGPLNSMALGLLFLDECDERQQGDKRTANKMAFTITDKHINMECCALMEQPSPADNLVHVKSTHELLVQQQGKKRTVHKQKTEQHEASLGGMKNLLMTSTLCSCYVVQNVVIDQMQYLPHNANLCGVNQGEGVAQRPAYQNNGLNTTQPPWELNGGQNNQKMPNNLPASSSEPGRGQSQARGPSHSHARGMSQPRHKLLKGPHTSSWNSLTLYVRLCSHRMGGEVRMLSKIHYEYSTP